MKQDLVRVRVRGRIRGRGMGRGGGGGRGRVGVGVEVRVPSDHLGGQLETDEASRAGLGQQQRPPFEQRIPVVSHGSPHQARVRRLSRVG